MAESVKAPDARRFVRDVMRRLNCKTVRELARALNWSGDQERKLYKWEAGEQAPNMRSTLALLNAAGLLLEEPAKDRRSGTVAPAAARGGTEVAAAAIVKEMRSGFRKLDRRLQDLEQQRSPEADLSPPRAVRGGSR